MADLDEDGGESHEFAGKIIQIFNFIISQSHEQTDGLNLRTLGFGSQHPRLIRLCSLTSAAWAWYELLGGLILIRWLY